MTLIFPDQGEALTLEYLVNKTGPQELILRLFQNDVTSGLSSAQIEALDETDFAEATFEGYNSIPLTGASWSTNEGNPTEVEYAQQSFTATEDQAPQTIYGYYFTRANDGQLVAFEYFDGPATVEFENDVIRVTPRITAQDIQD